MDLVSTKKKLLHFRLKDLKDVLTQLGLSKQGKKQDLVEKILALLSNEVSNVHGSTKKNLVGKKVGDIIDDVHRKRQGASSSINEESSIEVNSMKRKEEVVDSVYLDKKIRCPCGRTENEYLIQCADPQCRVLQHVSCVVIPEDCSGGIPTIPCQFYCEICRINRADPFWMTMGYLLSPVKLITSNIPADGTTSILQSVEKSFQLTRTDRCLLQNEEYDVQAWCILLSDKVPFRMQWPLYADLKVNGVPVRTVNRPGSQLLGANGRDEGPMIAIYMAEGINQISLSGSDARRFCLGVRLIKRRTVQQILNLILGGQNGEPFEDALARVCRCIGVGMAATNEDSDSDLEVIADCVTVNLRCPMSGSRIRTAGRFRPCAHMGCFDLETFVRLNQRSRKWQCPICLKNYSLEDITVDPYFNRIANMLQDCEEDATEIEVKPDGSWRSKNGFQFRNLEQWHLPDGSLCVSTTDVVLNMEAKQLEEGIPGHINPEQSTKRWNVQASSMNHLGVYIENNSQKVITMSSSSSESHGDDGGSSINQDSVGQFNTSANDGHETNTISYFNTTAKTRNKNTPASVRDLDVIFLSDSEEENANLTSPETISITEAVKSFGHSFSAAPGISNAYTENLALNAVVSSSLNFFNNNGNDFEMSHQEFGSGTRADSPFELLDTDNVLDALIDSGYTPVTSSAPIVGFALTSECSTDPGRQVVASSVCHSDIEMNDSLVTNPLAFVCADQTLLPSQPPGLSMQYDLGNNPQTSNGTFRENFNSCGLENNGGGGNGAAGVHPNPATTNGLDLASLSESNEGLNDGVKSNGTRNRKISNGPFSFPRQPRSVRRPYP